MGLYLCILSEQLIIKCELEKEINETNVKRSSTMGQRNIYIMLKVIINLL